MTDTIEAALERCAKELSVDFDVYLIVEKGAVSVCASGWRGLQFCHWEKDGDYPDHSVPERILLALEWAKEQERIWADEGGDNG